MILSAIFEWCHVVTLQETDVLGHANNEAYLRWMNEAAVVHSAACGWPTERYLELGQGWVVRRHEIEYLRPAFPQTEVIVRTWVRSFEKASSWRCYSIHCCKDGLLLARGQTLWVWITHKTGRPGRIPPEFVAVFPVLPEPVFKTGPEVKTTN